jgi:thiamine pyrophosphate-dependent acetolactate synthase large subunit-like protein
MKPQYILTNWKARLAYVLLSAAIGADLAYVSREVPVVLGIGSFVGLALLRITLEVRGQSRR